MLILYSHKVKIQNKMQSKFYKPHAFGDRSCYEYVVLDCRLKFSAGLQNISENITKFCSDYRKHIITLIQKFVFGAFNPEEFQ